MIAYNDIGADLAVFRRFLDSQRMLRIGLDPVVQIGTKREYLFLPFAFHGKFNRRKGSILHLDATAFDRRTQPVISVIVSPQYRGKQLYQGFSADWGTFVIPGTVTRNPDVVGSRADLRAGGGLSWRLVSGHE